MRFDQTKTSCSSQQNMGNFSLAEATDKGFDCDPNGRNINLKDDMEGSSDGITIATSCTINGKENGRNKSAQKKTQQNSCGLSILPPKHPSVTKSTKILSDRNPKYTTKIKQNEKNDTPTSKKFFRKNRSSSLDIFKPFSKSNANPLQISSHGDNKGSTKSIYSNLGSNNSIHSSSTKRNDDKPASASKKSFMDGILSPRITRHFSFSSKRGTSSKKEGKGPLFQNAYRNCIPNSSALPTYRENSTVASFETMATHHDNVNNHGKQRLSNVPSLSSCSLNQSCSSLYSGRSSSRCETVSSYPISHNYLRRFDSTGSFESAERNCYTNGKRDPAVFGPRRSTSYCQSHQRQYNPHLFLDPNQGTS